MNAARRRRQGSRRDPAIDTAVLAATRRLLVEHGYSATTIDLIAATAGVSRPAVYRRWSSKAQLVHEAVFPDLGPEPPEDDFVAEITRLCAGAVRMYGDPAVREAIPGLMVDLRSDRRLRKVLSDRLEAAARSQLAARVEDAAAAGVARQGISCRHPDGRDRRRRLVRGMRPPRDQHRPRRQGVDRPSAARCAERRD